MIYNALYDNLINWPLYGPKDRTWFVEMSPSLKSKSVLHNLLGLPQFEPTGQDV